MTAKPDLLPLRDWMECLGEINAEDIRDYARANVAHATAAKDAEIEALRELCGMAYQLAGVHDAPEKWLDALSNAAAGRPFSTDGLLPYWPQAVCEAEARAERLAELLDQAYGYVPTGTLADQIHCALLRFALTIADAALAQENSND